MPLFDLESHLWILISLMLGYIEMKYFLDAISWHLATAAREFKVYVVTVCVCLLYFFFIYMLIIYLPFKLCMFT